MKLSVSRQMYIILAATLWWFTAAPKPLKIEVFGVTQPPGWHRPYILGDTTRPGHVTCFLVWSKSDRKRLRKTLQKTNKQTNKQTETDTTKMVTWPWTNYTLKYALCKSAFNNQFSDLGRAIGVMCVCVCRCPNFGIKWPWPGYLACWFTFTVSGSSSKVKVRGKISQ